MKPDKGNNNGNNNKRNIMGLVSIIFWALLFTMMIKSCTSSYANMGTVEVPYTTFKEWLAEDKIDTVNVENGKYTFTLRDGVYWYDSDGSVTTIEAAGDTCEALLYGLPAGKYQLEETVVPEHFFPAPPVAVEITLETTSETPREVVVTNTPQVKLGIDADKFNVVIAMALTLIIGSGVGIVALVRHRRKR